MTIEGPRPARIAERDDILALLNYVHRTLPGRAGSVAEDWAHVYAPQNLRNVLIVTAGNRVIASTGVWVNDIQMGDAALRVGGINCVATLPEYRSQGLGSTMMQAAHRLMHERGCHVGLLSTKITNWYRRLGWERAGSARSYYVDRGNVGLLPTLPNHMRVRVGEASDLAALLRLRHADRLGGVGRGTDVAMILTAKKNPRLFLAERADGEALAYLLARDAAVIEWGGATEVLMALLRCYFESIDDPTVSTSLRDASFTPALLQFLSLCAPANGHPLLQQLDRLRIPFSSDYCGMMYIVNLRGILDAFGHYDLTVVEQDGLFTLARGRHLAQLDRRLLAKWLFGPEMVSRFGGRSFPLPFWQWPLEHV